MDLAPLFWACSAGLVATVTPYGFAMLPADISCYLATEDGWQSGAPLPATGLGSVGLQAPDRLRHTLSRRGALRVGVRGTTTPQSPKTGSFLLAAKLSHHAFHGLRGRR